MDGSKFFSATLALAVSATVLGSAPADASAGPTMQRIKGTVGFAPSSDAQHVDVVTSSGMPDRAETYAGCSSLAAVSLADGAMIMLGGRTDFVTPPGAGGPGNLRYGALKYQLPGRPPLPLVIATQYGTVFVAHGSGYVVAGSSGVQAVVSSGDKNDVMFVKNDVVSVIPTGQSLVAGASDKPQFLANSAVNNSALYQFNDGRNPLGTDATAAVSDPASSPASECSGAAAGAGAGTAALLGLLGAGAVAVAVGHGSDSGASPTPGSMTPTPFGTATPTPSGTATPTPSGTATPTPSGTATPTPSGTATPTPSGTATPTPSGTATPTPSGTATPTPSGTATPTPSGTATPSATPTATAVPTPTPTPAGTATPTPGGSATPTPAGTATPKPTASPALGHLTLNPSSSVLDAGVGSPASSAFTAMQPGYTGKFKASAPQCAVGLLGTPTSSVRGNTIMMHLPAQLVAVNLLCEITVTGGGGQTATEPVDVVVTALGGATPTPVPSGSPTATPRFGPVVLNPASTLLSPGVGSPASATFTVSQTGFSGKFKVAQPSCPVSLLGSPSATISGDTVTVKLPAQLAALDILCSVTVTGGGGMSASEPVTIDVTALGGPTPTPSPSASAGNLGPVVAVPASVLLNPAVGNAATQKISVSQTGYNGKFTAVLDGCLSIGNPPSVSVNGKTVTFALPAQTVAASLGCSAVITGGGGQTATVPVTISVSALGAPSPQPTSSGTAGAGPLTASPTSVLLNASAVAPATQNIVVNPSSEGPFTATTTCSLVLGAHPVTTVSGNVVTITAPAQVVTAPVACTTLIVSSTTGNSVSVPVLVSATATGPAQPTPSPNPTGHGPLYANPGSVLLNPGITTGATQNIVISDHGYNGAYTAVIAPGCLALQQPAVTLVQRNVAMVSVPGQLLNAALLCNIQISDGTQTIEVPVTISATLLAGLTEKPRSAAIAFRPPSLALERAGSMQSIDVVGNDGPYRASAICPPGNALEATMAGDRASVRAAAIGTDGTCMLTIAGRSGTYGQVPVRLGSGLRGGPEGPLLPGRAAPAPMQSSLAMRVGEVRELALIGSGPFALSNDCPRVTGIMLEGSMLRVAARAAGTCSVMVRSATGETQRYAVNVRAR